MWLVLILVQKIFTPLIIIIFSALPELKALKDTLECNVVFVGSLLVRQLKRRDILYSRRDVQYGITTAFLQAISAKRSMYFIIFL